MLEDFDKENYGSSTDTRVQTTIDALTSIDPSDYWSNLFLANLLGVQGKNAEAEVMYELATSA
jgi:hypothetical protein